MVLRFSDTATSDIANGRSSKAARQALPVELHDAVRRKIDAILAAHNVSDLRSPPGNRLERLSGNRAGQYSVRINDQYRVCFAWDEEDGASRIEITDYH